MRKKHLAKYSFGLGDRFAHQAKAQLAAMLRSKQKGITVTPVWNKSYREHRIIGSTPLQTALAARRAVRELNWRDDYFVDADHIGMENVDFFLDSCDFFTLDVAGLIGVQAENSLAEGFIKRFSGYSGMQEIAESDRPLKISNDDLIRVAHRYLAAIREAGRIYRYVAEKKAGESFIVEVSMDETSKAQTPGEIFFILAALSDEGVPLQTIAPKFPGRFNKGIDYVGDVRQFENDFEQLLAAIRFAVREFGLPPELKPSIHSGSDKFSLYPIMRKIMRKFDSGLHLKTAGTTWLEELIGLAEADAQGLRIVKDIYQQALERFDELCAPYAAVIDIDKNRLPSATEVESWQSETLVAALEHNPTNGNYNKHFRQLLHVSYKIAAEMGRRFSDALEIFEPFIATHVTENIYGRHILPLFAEKTQTKGVVHEWQK